MATSALSSSDTSVMHLQCLSGIWYLPRPLSMFSMCIFVIITLWDTCFPTIFKIKNLKPDPLLGHLFSPHKFEKLMYSHEYKVRTGN